MTKHVLRISYDIEKQESWVNDMARHGWMMTSFFMGVYTFEEGEPGEYLYRCELLPRLAGSAANRTYLLFLESMNIEVVTMWLNQIVYRRKASEGALDIYSDSDSRIKQYRRWSGLLFALGSAEWLIAVIPALRFIEHLTTAETDLHGLIPSLTVILFAAFVGTMMLRAAWRFRKKYSRLKMEQHIFE